MMNEVVRQVWEEIGAQPDETASGLSQLCEECALESEAYLKAVDPLRRWLNVGFAAGRRRPSAEFYETLFGYGRAACEAVLNRYLEQAADPRTESLALWRAVGVAARIGRAKGFIAGWDLDGWKPLGGDDSAKARLVGYLPRDVDEQLRALAFVTRRQLSEVVTDALREYVARHEEKIGPLPKRPETAQAVAS